MPGLPYSNPVTLDELYRNLVHDLGWYPETLAGQPPTTMREILLAVINGMYNSSLATYGSGVDGALQFTALANGAGSVTLWNGTTLTASSNTYTLTQDLWLGQTESANVETQPTIQSGVTINANGFRIFCQGHLVNNGAIQSNGSAAAGTTAGAALSYTSTISNTTVGTAGGTGATTGNNAGTNATTALGGAGGIGGNNASTAGGAGGTVTAPAATFDLPFSLPLATIAKAINATTAFALLTGGAGGGSGQGDGGNNSGAGGGGGGIVMVAAQRLGGTGTISANGGAGSAAANTGNSGGGGGGGGGLVLVVSRSVQSTALATATAVSGQTIAAAGGAGGIGNGSGTAGAAGAAGRVVLIPD